MAYWMWKVSVVSNTWTGKQSNGIVTFEIIRPDSNNTRIAKYDKEKNKCVKQLLCVYLRRS